MASTSPRREDAPRAETEPDERLTTQESDEDTPLLSRPDHEDEEEAPAASQTSRSSAASSLLRAIGGSPHGKKRGRRWPSYLALAVLIVVGIVILIGGFFAPEVAKEYASQAVDFKPTRLSIDSISDSGVNARVQGNFIVDASRVERRPVRDLGRFGSWFVRSTDIGRTLVAVSLPEYGDVLIGTAEIPPIHLDLRDGHATYIDFVTHVKPGEHDPIRRLAKDWIDGRLGDLRVKAEASVPIKTGFLQLNGRFIEQSFLIEHSRVPAVPQYTIRKLNFTEVHLPSGGSGIAADVTITVENPYPVEFEVPPLGFGILVDNCLPTDPLIMVADAQTHSIRVKPKHDVRVSVTGFVRRLPETFLQECPGSSPSPFDSLLAGYLHGDPTTAYVQGSDSPSAETPAWISELMQGVTVPVTVPGHPMKDLIKKFSMQNVRFSLPDFFGEPGTPAAQPKISATVDAIIALPEEMNFNVDVHRIRSNATVYHEKSELGILDLQKWHPARSRKVTLPKQNHQDLEVKSDIERAPLFITNQTAFEEVVSGLIGGTQLNLSVKADVDVEVQTALGVFVAHKIPAKGSVPVKPVGGGRKGGGPDYKSLMPRVGNLSILTTTKDSLTIGAVVNFTNPTNYSAEIPYFSVNIEVNKTVVGYALIKDVVIKEGNNTNIPVRAVWEPSAVNGTRGALVGRKALSQYLSGYNLTLTMRTSSESVPAQPELGEAMSKFAISLPAPNLGGSEPPDGDGDGDGEGETRHHFIKDTTFHLFSSTASFVLDSPLKHTTIFLEYMDARAFYKGEAVGRIMSSERLEVPPGESETPRLAVIWDLSSVGYDAIKKALGGQLKLDAYATVRVAIGNWQQLLWYRGSGIGVKVRV